MLAKDQLFKIWGEKCKLKRNNLVSTEMFQNELG